MSQRTLLQRVLGLNKRAASGTPTFSTAANGWLGAIQGTNTLAVGSDSLQLAAVYACVSKISDTIAGMGAVVETVSEDGSKEPLHGHPATHMLSVEPNPHMGAYEFWQMVVSDALLYGQGHAILMPDDNEMYWIPATEIEHTIDRKDGKKYYKYTGAPTAVPADRILEIKAFRGESPTKVQLQNLKTAKSVQDFGATFFENGGMLGGILSTKEPLSLEQMQQATDRWSQEYMGSGNAHKVAILGGGFSYQALSVPLDQLQYLDSKKYSTEEIARFYSVPPAMIGMDGNTAYSNYEQQALQFAQGCILPWVRRIELEVERKVLRNDDGLSCRLDIDSLMRADSAARSAFYHTMLQDGCYTINEVRAKEGMGPVEGGDNNHIGLNQIPLTSMDAYAEGIVSNSNGPDAGSSEPKTKGEGGSDNEETSEVDNQSK